MGVRAWWTWLLDKEHRAAVGFVGAGIAAVAAAGSAVFVHFGEQAGTASSPPSVSVSADRGGIGAGRDVAVKAEPGGTAVLQTGAGAVNVNNFPPSTIDEIKKLGVTEAALKSFFTILERQQVPPEDLDSTLREIANRYQELEQKLARFTSDDPKVVALKQAASQALERGEFARTEALLLQAKQKDIAAAEAMQERARERLLSAAESAAELGALKETELAYAESAGYYAEAAELVPEGEALIRAENLNLAGSQWFEAGKYPEAQALLARALAIREDALGPAHPHVAQSLNNLARLYDAQGRPAEAEPLYQRALAIREDALGPAHPHVAQSLNNLAALYHAQGRYEEAEPLLRQALSIVEEALGLAHPYVATTLNNLAELYDAQGRYEEAEPLMKRALAIREKALGAAHPDVAQSLNNLAALYHAQGRYAEAEPLMKRALSIVEQVLGPEHPDVALSLNNLARLYDAQGRYAEAEPLYQRALSIVEQVLGPDHPHVATSLNNLALVYNAQGRSAEAEPLMKRALSIVEDALGPAHPNTVMVRGNYEKLLAEMRGGEAAPVTTGE